MLVHMKWALGAACLTAGSASALCGWKDAVKGLVREERCQGVVLQHEAMDVPLVEYWHANGARDQSLIELGWSNFL
jgi:hypothetical protein